MSAKVVEREMYLLKYIRACTGFSGNCRMICVHRWSICVGFSGFACTCFAWVEWRKGRDMGNPILHVNCWRELKNVMLQRRGERWDDAFRQREEFGKSGKTAQGR